MLPKRGAAPAGLSLSALTWTPEPGVLKKAPRARGASAALKKSGGRKFGAESSSETPSQLISRRPVPREPGSPPLFGPRRSRYCSTTAVMSPAPETTVGDGPAYGGGWAAATWPRPTTRRPIIEVNEIAVPSVTFIADSFLLSATVGPQ